MENVITICPSGDVTVGVAACEKVSIELAAKSAAARKEQMDFVIGSSL
jgi:hypothetical protein